MIIVTIVWFINYGCGASAITRTKEWMQEYMLAMQPQKNLQCTPKGWQQIQKYFAVENHGQCKERAHFLLYKLLCEVDSFGLS